MTYFSGHMHFKSAAILALTCFYGNDAAHSRAWLKHAHSFDRCGPLARSISGSPRFTDFPLLCACSESSLTNLIGSGLNLLCLQSHSKPECRWTWPEVVIFGADQKERGLWGREWYTFMKIMYQKQCYLYRMAC